MEHAEALETNASDRYLLGQLSAAEADAFEEHYFDCAACAEDVRLGTSFLEAGRRLVREPAAPPVPAVASVVPIGSRRRGFRWIPAAAVAAILAILVNIGLLMRMQSAAPTLGVVASNPDVHFVGETRSERAPTVLKIPEGAVALLPVDVSPPRPYGRYEARVLRGGDEIAARPLSPGMVQDTLTISLPDPGLGTYDLVIVGIEPAGETEIVRHRFEVTR